MCLLHRDCCCSEKERILKDSTFMKIGKSNKHNSHETRKGETFFVREFKQSQ